MTNLANLRSQHPELRHLSDAQLLELIPDTDLPDVPGTRPLPDAVPPEVIQALEAQPLAPPPALSPPRATEGEDRMRAQAVEKALSAPPVGTAATKGIQAAPGQFNVEGKPVARGLAKGLMQGAAGTTSLALTLADEAAGRPPGKPNSPTRRLAEEIERNLVDVPYEAGMGGVAQVLAQYMVGRGPASQLTKKMRRSIPQEALTTGGAMGVSGVPAVFFEDDEQDSLLERRMKSAIEGAGADYVVMKGVALEAKAYAKAGKAAKNWKDAGGENGELAMKRVLVNPQYAKSLEAESYLHLGLQPANKGRRGSIKLPPFSLKANTRMVNEANKFAKASEELFLGIGSLTPKGVEKVLGGKLGENMIRPMRSTLRDIHPSLQGVADKFMLDQGVFRMMHENEVKPFLMAFKKLPKKDRVAINEALLNVNKQTNLLESLRDVGVKPDLGKINIKPELGATTLKATAPPPSKGKHLLSGLKALPHDPKSRWRPDVTESLRSLSPAPGKKNLLESLSELRVDKPQMGGISPSLVKVYDILEKHKGKDSALKEKFDVFRKASDKLWEFSNEHGIETQYLKDYVARQPVNYEGLAKKLGVGDVVERRLRQEQVLKGSEFKEFDNRLDALNHQKKHGGDFVEREGKWIYSKKPATLSTEERREAILQVLEPSPQPGKVGSQHKRILDEITPELIPFYGGLEERVLNNIHGNSYRAAKNVFEGKVEGKKGYNETIAELLDRKLITYEQGKKAQEIFETLGRAGGRSVSDTGQLAKNLINITSIANPFSTLRQLSEPFLTAARHGVYHAGSGIKPAFLKKIKVEDLGLESIGQEFAKIIVGKGKGGDKMFSKSMAMANHASDKVLNGLLSGVAFKLVDRVSKNHLINTALVKAKKLAGKPNSKAFKEWKAYWSSHFDDHQMSDLLKAVKAGDKDNPNLKLYLFSELSDQQPVSMAAMPKLYADHPEGRLFYTLKSFALTLLELTRKDVVRKLGSAERKEVIAGLRAATYLGTLFGGANYTISEFHDWLLDRDTEKMDLMGVRVDGNVADALLQFGGLSKYTVRGLTHPSKTRRTAAAAEFFLPPKSGMLINLPGHGLDSIDAVYQVPVVGRLYSERFPGAYIPGTDIWLPQGKRSIQKEIRREAELKKAVNEYFNPPKPKSPKFQR